MRPLRYALLGLLALLGACSAPATAPDDTSAQPPPPAAVSSPCPPMNDKQKQIVEEEGKAALVPLERINLHPAIAISDYVRYCGDAAGSILCMKTPGRLLTLAEVTEVDARLRSRFEYRSDLAMYGQDFWLGDTLCGDCEDYALTLASWLRAAGAGSEGMWLMIWAPSPETGHATLVVETADAGTVEIGVSYDETPHPFDDAKGERFASISAGTRNGVSPYKGHSLWTDNRMGYWLQRD